MNRKIVVCLLTTALLSTVPAVGAQQLGKIPRIGVVSGSGNSPDEDSSAKRLQRALQDIGYTEGKNILIEYRYSEGNRDRIPSILAELMNLKIDVLFSTQSIVIRAAKQATKTIPIVMAVTADPVAAGLVDSLARPGGNITGITRLTRELSGKRLELLTEIIPRISRVGILTTASFTGFKNYEAAAHSLKVGLQILEVKAKNPDFPGAYQAAVKGGVVAIIITSTPGLAGHQKQVANLAVKNQLPLMSESAVVVEAGGLVSYDADRADIFRRAAIYIDKILTGAKPAELPVEQPTKFDFVINLKTAKQIGLTIPPNVLARADRVIR